MVVLAKLNALVKQWIIDTSLAKVSAPSFNMANHRLHLYLVTVRVVTLFCHTIAWEYFDCFFFVMPATLYMYCVTIIMLSCNS